MLTFEKFTGINNVLPERRMSAGDLIKAQDVDIGLTGEITRRHGIKLVDERCHKNLHQATDFILATVGAQLTAIHPDGSRFVIHPSIGPQRVWYCNLPDGRTTYSNGLIQGVTNGRIGLDRSVSAPTSLGVTEEAFGSMHAGQYRYFLSYVRLADQIEGPAIDSISVAYAKGGMRWDGLPQRDGYAINVYLSGQDGEGAFLAGTTDGSSFEYSGSNDSLVLPCRTLGALPFPVGTITAFWRGRVLTAVGNVLHASSPSSPHLAEWQDFKQLSSPITAIQPVLDGVYVGTTEDLIFLSGTSWEQMSYVPTKRGCVVQGSGVEAPGHLIQLGDGIGNGQAMLCIAGGDVVAGFAGGQTISLTANRYRTAVKEVCATFREINGIPQYLAVPQ